MSKNKKGWETVKLTEKTPNKAITKYHALVDFIREKKCAEIRLNPNLIESLRKQHHTLNGNLDEDTQGLQQEPPLIIEGCLIIPDWSK